MVTTRDYYADLELPANADIPEIKKQFRKLALKYHPDRNPGREEEVNSKFQIIQSAHEILTDPEQKSKYDATRGKSRYPTASGVRGNPWANMGTQFPPPPRRNPQPTPRNPTSGAQRWHTRFSTGVPPTAKQHHSSDPEAKKNAARAFENMRKTQPGSSAKNNAGDSRPPPPPPPPRTESARQRAQASFGSRKTGFHPRSAMPGDEPPVSNSNYTTRPVPDPPVQEVPEQQQPRERRRPRPEPMPDPLSQFRENETFMDPRQRSPYSTHGGEKTNPFDGIPLGRAKSTRETTRHGETSSDDGASPTQRFRSSSMPKPRSEGAPRTDSSDTGDQSQSTVPPGRTFATPTLRSRRRTNRAPAPTESTSEASGDNTTKPHENSSNEPSMYEKPPSFKNYEPSLSRPDTHIPPSSLNLQEDWSITGRHDAGHDHNHDSSSNRTSPSGRLQRFPMLSPFERQQHRMLDRLIRNMKQAGELEEDTSRNIDATQIFASDNANVCAHDSFSFDVNPGTFVPTPPGPSRFASSSADDINTRFVSSDATDSWKFSAGGGQQESSPKARSQSGSRLDRQTPSRRPTVRRAETSDASSPTEKPEKGFDPQGWSDKFGPQIFTPQPAQPASGSPTRPNRTGSKKSKPVKTTVGNAALVDDNSSDDEEFNWPGRRGQAAPTGTDSPQAMDIDSPPRAPAESSPEPTGVRNINVEPSRPEWRSGDVEGSKEDAKPVVPPKQEINPNAVGSEDSEEFRATFADLKNVAPFAPESSGLKSFDDLKNNLPFESKPSEDIPLSLPKARPLDFPHPPIAPRLPPTVAINGMKPNMASWEKYVKEFQAYLELWDVFNGQVVEHFTTRQQNITRNRVAKGYAFLDARGDGGVQEYYNWVQQDNDVRRRWNAACEEHEQRFREFMAFKQKMK